MCAFFLQSGAYNYRFVEAMVICKKQLPFPVCSVTSLQSLLCCRCRCRLLLPSIPQPSSFPFYLTLLAQMPRFVTAAVDSVYRGQLPVELTGWLLGSWLSVCGVLWPVMLAPGGVGKAAGGCSTAFTREPACSSCFTLSCLPQYQKEKKTPWVLTVAATGTVVAQLLIRGPVVVNQLLMLQEATEAELRDEADKINGLLVKIDGLNRLNFSGDIHDKISSAHVRPHHCSNTPQMVLSDV